MSLTESIVEDAALTMPAATLTRPLPQGEEWELVPQSREVVHGSAFAWLRGDKPQMAPGESAAERESYGEVVLVGRFREVGIKSRADVTS